jgi:beta-glucosidase
MNIPSRVRIVNEDWYLAFLTLPPLDRFLQTSDGKPGWEGTFHSTLPDSSPDSFSFSDDIVKSVHLTETHMFIFGSPPAGISEKWLLRLRGNLVPRAESGKFEFGLTAAGRAKLFVDGKLVIDNWTMQRRGVSFFNTGTVEERGIVELEAGKAHEIVVEFCNYRGPAAGDPDEGPIIGPGVTLGGRNVIDSEDELVKAEELAKQADVVVVVVGLNSNWETEGNDRKNLDLPGRTNELVERVAKANPKTVVVSQSVSLFSSSALCFAKWSRSETGVSDHDALGRFGQEHRARLVSWE